MAGYPMPTTRRTISRPPARRITPKAVEIFRTMLALEEQDSINSEYWNCAAALVDELRLRPWQWPPYEPKLYNALKAASDA
jgi:hypothetical protein